MKKIGFLYIYGSYAIYHSISIAIELAKNPNNEVHLLGTRPNCELASRILADFNCKNIIVKQLNASPLIAKLYNFRITAQITIKYYLLKYRNLFNTYDAFVCTFYDDLYLKKILKRQNIKYIFNNHGISNRAYSFDEKITEFDLFFLLGEEEKKRRNELNQLTSDNFEVTGFLKYEAVKKYDHRYLFKNKNLTILYNPHWDKNYTSFEKFGKKLFDFFKNNPNYNLIFAPHLVLTKRNFNYKKLALSYSNCDNILIDLGSEFSNNMTYTKVADFYLGDISSQAMEFIFINARPCLFLDAHGINDDKTNRPLSWNFGAVVSELTSIEAAIKNAISDFERTYKQLQIKNHEMTFYKGKESSSYIAAQAIDDLLKTDEN